MAIIILGFYQTYSGYGLWHSPGTITRGVYIAWGVLLAFWIVLYAAGFSLLPRQWRERKAALGIVGESMAKRRDSEMGLARPSENTERGVEL